MGQHWVSCEDFIYSKMSPATKDILSLSQTKYLKFTPWKKKKSTVNFDSARIALGLCTVGFLFQFFPLYRSRGAGWWAWRDSEPLSSLQIALAL